MMADEPNVEDRLQSHVPHTARIWNYWLGGKDHYPVDREAGSGSGAHPGIGWHGPTGCSWGGRALSGRRGGIRQFLDIGTGLPTADNTHEVAQRVAPDVADRVRRQRPPGAGACAGPAHQLARRAAPTTSTPTLRDRTRSSAGRQDAGLHPAGGADAAGRRHFIGDDEELQRIIDRLLAAVPSGSYIVVANTTTAVNGETTAEAVRVWNLDAQPKLKLRTPSGSPSSSPVSRWWSRGGVVLTLAPRAAMGRRPAGRGRPVVRGRPQAMKIAPPYAPRRTCGAATEAVQASVCGGGRWARTASTRASVKAGGVAWPVTRTR